MEYCSSIKKNEIFPFVTTWLDLEDIMLSEISQTEKVRSHICEIEICVGVCGGGITNLTDTENRLGVARGGVWGG